MPGGVLRSSTRRTDRSSAIRRRRASEAQDGADDHSPYTQAFLRVAREPNLPIEQLFKRVRLEVNNRTDGRQIPWESSSLTSDFYFFGDTAVAATRAPDRSPIVQIASNLPSRSVRQAYDYVLSEGSPQHYQEFIQLFPNDPLCDRIRVLLGNLLQAHGLAQDRARELSGRLQVLLRQLRQQPVCEVRVETAGAAQECAADAVHPSDEVAGVQADQHRHLSKGISRIISARRPICRRPSKIITLPAKGRRSARPTAATTTAPSARGHALPGKIETKPDRRQQGRGQDRDHAGQDRPMPVYRCQEQRQRRHRPTFRVMKINNNPTRAAGSADGQDGRRATSVASFGGGNSSPRFATQSRSSLRRQRIRRRWIARHSER